MNHGASAIERLNRVAQRNRITPQIEDGMDVADEMELIRGHLNATFFRSAERWMLPNWATKMLWEKGKRQDLNDVFHNNKYRNWIVIGAPGSKSYAMSDHTGLVTIRDECGSLDFWPKADEIEFPSLQDYDGPRLSLVTVDDQMYEWKTTSGPLEFNRLLYHIVEDDREYIFNEIVLRNLSLEPQEISFYVALRPLSIRGMEPIESLSYDSSKKMLFSNDCLAIIADKTPAMIVMDTFDNPNLMGTLTESEDRMDKSYTAARGNGIAVMKYNVQLRPAGHETLVFASPLFKASESDSSTSVNMSPRLRDDAVARWFDFNDDSPKGAYPDEELMMATAQGKTALVIQARNFVNNMDAEKLIEKTSDLARIHMALSRSGCFDIANTVALEIVE
ncbi:MAG: hypothetical protein ACXAEF_11655, partial [Candidatus Thorarchaeota archaeon]